MIRPAVRSDLPHILAVARDRYGEFDETEANAWWAKCEGNPDVLLLVSPNGFGAGALVRVFWAPADTQGHLLFVAVRRDAPPQACEGYQLVKSMLDWSKARGASSFRISTDTGIDLGPIARKIGAKPNVPSYTVRL